jgi:hypothetical protein
MATGVRTPEAELRVWRNATDPLYDAGIAVFAVRGNHELACDTECWHEVFHGRYAMPENGPENEEGLTYSVAHKNALILGFDNYIGDRKINVDWVKRELDANPLPHVFAFSHEAAFAAHHIDCLDDDLEERDLFWQSLREAGARVYFGSHDHFFDHARVDDGDGNEDNDIHQFIVGSAGGPLYDFEPPYPGENSGMEVMQIDHAREFGFVLVEVDRLDVTLTWIPLVGVAGASWSYTVSP